MANQTKKLIEILLNNDLNSKTTEEIIEKSNGNPLYIEEALHYLVDSGGLIFNDLCFKEDNEIEKISIPNTLKDLLKSRISNML